MGIELVEAPTEGAALGPLVLTWVQQQGVEIHGSSSAPIGRRDTDSRTGMEHLWSPADATGGNRSQMGQGRRRPGKEGVRGSSPSEGSAKAPQAALFRSVPLAGTRTCRSD